MNGYLSRKIIPLYGSIEIQLNIIEVLQKHAARFSEEDFKKVNLLNRKVSGGFKDLDALIQEAVYNSRKLNIDVITGLTAIIDADIKKALAEAVYLYNIRFHRVLLTDIENLSIKIRQLDQGDADVICIARGGGDLELNTFEKPALIEAILNRRAVIASAISHTTNVTLFEKVADKKFAVPFDFGNYLKDIYNRTIEELKQSKAKLTKTITEQLNVNYNHQFKNLEKKLNDTVDLHKKKWIV